MLMYGKRYIKKKKNVKNHKNNSGDNNALKTTDYRTALAGGWLLKKKILHIGQYFVLVNSTSSSFNWPHCRGPCVVSVHAVSTNRTADDGRFPVVRAAAALLWLPLRRRRYYRPRGRFDVGLCVSVCVRERASETDSACNFTVPDRPTARRRRQVSKWVRVCMYAARSVRNNSRLVSSVLSPPRVSGSQSAIIVCFCVSVPWQMLYFDKFCWIYRSLHADLFGFDAPKIRRAEIRGSCRRPLSGFVLLKS